MNTSKNPPLAGRRFTMLDAMILVAVTACGCAVDGWLNGLIRSQGSLDAMDILGSYLGAGQYPQVGVLAMLLTLPIAAAWTLALIPIGLVGPRPRPRHRRRRPGHVACCAFALALAFESALIGGWMAVVGGNQALALLELSPLLPVLVAPAILAAWMALILGRRWRPEPTWVDRSGRALGVFWVVAAVAGPILLATAFN